MTAPAGQPVVRFAPSPTGYFHVGSARTALFNWMFARRSGGTYLLRIEDTDTERNEETWVDGILSALAWLDLEPDRQPIRQSTRRDLYDTAAARLLASGHLYACECTREQVQERTKDNAIPGYDGHCRDRGLDPHGHALRFRVPDAGTTVVDDVVRGPVEFPNESIEDFVVVRSDGGPLFVLANVVDDIDMAITHVIRGVDLLPSSPKGQLLWRALEGDTAVLPVYAHLPLLVNEARQKISKRRDKVAIEDYRDEGFIAPAFANFLALLGWSHPDGEEIFQVADVVDHFRLEDVNHAPAFFDVQKMRHVNAVHLRALSVDAFTAACGPWLHGDAAPWPADAFDESAFARLAPLVPERVSVLSEVPDLVAFLFVSDPEPDESSWAALLKTPDPAAIVDAAIAAYEVAPWDADTLHETTNRLAEELGQKLGKAQAPIRVGVMGRSKGLPLFQSLEVLGRDRTLARLHAVRSRLAAA